MTEIIQSVAALLITLFIIWALLRLKKLVRKYRIVWDLSAPDDFLERRRGEPAEGKWWKSHNHQFWD
jgi:hypothetical protein